MALVDVDDVDAVGRPAQRQRPALQVVLPRGGLGVVDDLVEGRLADIQVGVAGQPGGRHLGHSVAAHGGMVSLSGNEDGNGAGAGDAARARARAWRSVSWAITATSWLVAAGSSGGQAGLVFLPPSAGMAGRDWSGADEDCPACVCAAALSRRSAGGRWGVHVAALAIQAAIPEAARTAAPYRQPPPSPPAAMPRSCS